MVFRITRRAAPALLSDVAPPIQSAGTRGLAVASSSRAPGRNRG